MNRRIAFLIVLLASLILTACGMGAGDHDAKLIRIAQGYQDAMNEHDLDKAAQYLSDDVVFVTPTDGMVNGKNGWELHALAAAPIRSEDSNFEVKEDWVSWNSHVTFDTFEADAVVVIHVVDGKIVYYRASDKGLSDGFNN